ncbi:MAG: DUF4097 domain-containing protein [Oscillospiraceae bacterium]|nr:DUF4097 domain-containing protein [Oscillospiraceae bacterium]
MKKLNLTLIVVWCIIGSLIIGLLAAGLIWNWNGLGLWGRGERVSGDGDGLVAELSSGLDGVNKILIDLTSDECTVIPVDEDVITVRQYGKNLPEGRIARIETLGGTLKVTTYNRSLGFSFFIFGWPPREYSRLEIYLPRAFNDKLAVDMTSGTLDFAGAIGVSDLNIDITSGIVRSDNEIRADNAVLDLTSGNIRLNGGLVTQNYLIDLTSGTIRVEGKTTGSGRIDITSGSVRLFGVEIAESLDIDATSGTIEVQVAGDPSIKFTGDKTSGTFNTYFDLNKNGGYYTGTSGSEPFKSINANITSGSVRITK